MKTEMKLKGKLYSTVDVFKLIKKKTDSLRIRIEV